MSMTPRTTLRSVNLTALYSYCVFLKADENQMYQQLNYRVLYTFFYWMLNQRRGKEGRRRQGIKYRSSLITYWKNFRTVYELKMEKKVDKETSRLINKCVRPISQWLLDIGLVLRCSLNSLTLASYPQGYPTSREKISTLH